MIPIEHEYRIRAKFGLLYYLQPVGIRNDSIIVALIQAKHHTCLMTHLAQYSNPITNIFALGGGIVGVLIVIILIVNSILWLFLPWLILSKLEQIRVHLRNIEYAAETTEQHTRPDGYEDSEGPAKKTIHGLND